MIKNWFITGDCHGNIDRFKRANFPFDNSEIAFIILGDACFNYFLDLRDNITKEKLCRLGYHYFLVRGNHEVRPTHLQNIHNNYNQDVKGFVYEEEDYPNIHYFIDGERYQINGYSVLVLGGAYSVDKYYRLERYGISPDASWEQCARAFWFKDEQLSNEEMSAIKNKIEGKSFDFILSHSCPISYEPEDLFLSGIDQSTVDKTTENFLEWVKDSVTWKYWFFGHYHEDRVERPRVEMFYYDYENIDDFIRRWDDYEKTNELPWHINISPNFYT